MAAAGGQDLDVETHRDHAGHRAQRSARSELEGGGLGGRHGSGWHFKAYKVVTTNNLGEVETRWTAPAVGVWTVKRLVSRPATHPQGAGELEAVLLSQVPPAK